MSDAQLPVPVSAGDRGIPVPAGYPRYTPTFGDEGEGSGLNLQRLLSALRRHLWLVAVVTILATAAGVLVARFIPPTYTVRATVWVERDEGERGPIRTSQLLASRSWLELLASYSVLDSVVEKERLYLEYPNRADSALFAGFSIDSTLVPGRYHLKAGASAGQYVLEREPDQVVESVQAGDSIGRSVGFRWRPSAAALTSVGDVRFDVLVPRQASDRLKRDGLRLDMQENSNFMRVGYTSGDPVRGARVLNTLLDKFVAQAADLKSYKLTESSKALEEQLQTVGTQLRQAEQELEAYRTRIITLPGEGVPVSSGVQQTQPQVLTQYFGEKLELERLRREREEVERAVALTGRSDFSPDALLTVDAVRQAPELNRTLNDLTAAEAELRDLRVKYTDRAQPVQQQLERIDSLRQLVPRTAQALLGTLRAREQALDQKISAATRELQNIPSRTITEQRLQRNVITLAEIFAQVQARFQAARLAEASSIPDVRVLDRAVAPDSPDKQLGPMIIGGAFLGGLGLAVVLVFLLDRFDRRLRYPDQVDQDMGLVILGAVPSVKSPKRMDAESEEAAQVVEAFRAIRMAVLHSVHDRRPTMLVITSPGPGDGKSFVASNLALSFAEAGQRTLLVDGDIRRGALHHLFSVQGRPGLVDVLAGDCPLADAVRATHHERLSLLPGGTRDRRAPELLQSPAMEALMAAARLQFDAIVIDSAPLGAGVDASVLAVHAANLVLVLRSGETDRTFAEAKLKELDRLPIRVLGAVINDVSLKERHYAYYSYVYGYSLDEEEASPRRLRGASTGAS